MRSFTLSKNAIPVHLAFIAGYLACVSSTPEGIASYLPLAWFIAGLIEIMLLFPSAKKGEDALMARSRVKKSIVRDPVFTLSLLSVVFLLIQTLNGPREAFFNPGTGNWVFSNPPLPDFPSSIERLLSLQGLFWGLISGTVLLAFRNCIGKKGRTSLLRYMAYISGAIAFIGIIGYARSSQPVDLQVVGFSFFESSFVAGVYFMMHFCLSFALLLQLLNNDSGEKSTYICLSFATVFNAAAVFYSFSCEVIFVFAFVLLFAIIYAIPYVGKRMAAGTCIKILGSVLALIGVALFLNFIAYPENKVNKTIHTLVSWQWHDEAEVVEQETIENVGWRIFNDNQMCGVGAWCTGAESCFGKYIADDEWEKFTDDDAATAICFFNFDFLQFLCEFGIIGTVLICSPFIFLLFNVVWGIARAAFPPKTKPSDSNSSSENENTPFQDRITPLIFFSTIAIVSSLVLSFKLTVFHNPAIIFTYSVIFATLSCFLPKPVRKTENEREGLRSHSFFASKNTSSGYDPRRSTGKIED